VHKTIAKTLIGGTLSWCDESKELDRGGILGLKTNRKVGFAHRQAALDSLNSFTLYVWHTSSHLQ